MARQELVNVLKGIDPLRQKTQVSKAQIMRDFCNMYLEKYAKIHSNYILIETEYKGLHAMSAQIRICQNKRGRTAFCSTPFLI